MNYDELDPDNQAKAIDKAQEWCIQQLSEMGCEERPLDGQDGEDMTTPTLTEPFITTEIGGMDPKVVGLMYKNSNHNAYATLAKIMLDSTLRKQFSAWVKEVAESQTYEIATPLPEDPSTAPVVL